MKIGFNRLANVNKVTLALVALVMMLAVACSNSQETPDPVAPPAAPQPATPVAQPDVLPLPAETAEPDTPKIFKMGIFEEPSTRNYWNYYGGPGGSVWTGYVLEGTSTTLYDYSHQRFDWIPILADGFPSDLTLETVDGEQYWTSEVAFKKGVQWSDGVEITSDDFVFVVNTVMDMELGNNFTTVVDPDFLSHVESLDPHTVKVFFNASDDEGNPQKPGLSVWQFGLGFTPILPKHYWDPVVAEAKQAGDIEAQQAALFSHDPVDEPTAGGFVFAKWEQDAFFQNEKDPNWWRTNTKVTQYENGAYQEDAPGEAYDVTFFGQPSGPKALELEIGPHVDSEIFNIYGSQDAAILALTNGDIDYVFNPLGLEKGFQDKVRSMPDLEVVTNSANSVRYLGFNTRKEPFNIPEFRKAIAVLIDKEFVANTILNGSAIPAYSMVPEGNGAWHNADVPKIGQGLSRSERLEQAVALLKQAGFTYEVEPVISEDGNFMEVQGEGLRLPNGTPVPELTILSPSAGYDPLRSTYAMWIGTWMNDAGIPTKTKLTGFNVIIDTLFSENVAEELDMWVLGWSLSLFPDFMEAYFHSRNIEDGVNWGGYSNPQYDQLAEAFLAETTVEGARDRVLEMQDFVAEDLPYVILFSPPMIDAYRPGKVKFPYTNALGGIQFWNGLQRSVQIE